MPSPKNPRKKKPAPSSSVAAEFNSAPAPPSSVEAEFNSATATPPPQDDQPSLKQTAQESAAWLLRQPAQGKTGEQLEYQGRQLTNLDNVLLQMMQQGKMNPVATMHLLTLGGVIRDKDAPPTPEEIERTEQQKKARKKAVLSVEATIKRQLQKANLWTDALAAMTRAVATARVQLEQIADQAYTTEPFIKEVSREGSSRLKTSPITDAFMRYTRQVTELTSQLVHRAIQLTGKQSSEADEEIIKALRSLNDLSEQ